MKTFFTVGATVALLGILSIPQSTHAYKTTDQAAIRLSDTTTLYLISYEFGFLNRETNLPIAAFRDNLSDNKAVVQFNVVDEAGNIDTKGTTYGLVVSDRTILNNKYHLDEGRAGKFTLVVIRTNEAREIKPLAVAITNLPMVLVKDGVEKDFALAESELKPYITPFVK